MSELNDFISVINGHIDYFGLKKRLMKDDEFKKLAEETLSK